MSSPQLSNQSLNTAAAIRLYPRLLRQDLRVLVDTRHKSKADGAPNRLCQFALVNRTETSLVAVLDATHGGHVFGHDGEVLEASAPSLHT